MNKNTSPAPKRIFSINVPAALIRRVDRIAWDRKVSRSRIISEMLAALLAAAETQPKEEQS